MAQNTLTQNVETAATVIKEVKEAIIDKGVEIPEGTHATEYPGYIAAMSSKTEFEELTERVEANENAIEGINHITVWGKELTGEVSGSLSNVGNISFDADNKYNIGTSAVRPNRIYTKKFLDVGNITESGDGESGVRLSHTGALVLQVSSNEITNYINPRIAFSYGDTETPTSFIREAYPGILSIPNQLRIGGVATEKQSSQLHVAGTANISGNITSSTINGASITSSGDGSQFLGNDGKYHNLQLNNYLSRSGGQMSGSLWMNYNKLHLGPYDTSVSGLSFVDGRGTLLESAESSLEYHSDIELYAKRDGNIILNTTNGKALYKDEEIATNNYVDTKVSTVENAIEDLRATIGILNDDLENVLNGN